MRYSIVHDGVKIELPKYTFDIDDKIAKMTEEINRGGSLRKISKRIFDFCAELIGVEELIKIVGDFDSCDPNELQILYRDMLSAYAEPLVQYEQEKLNGIYDFDTIEKVMDVAERAQAIRVV